MSTIKKESITNGSLQDIKSLLKESQQLNIEISNVMKDIEPLEFESYTDYFIINTFKRGRSESGKIDMFTLLRRDTPKYYQKIKRSTTKNTGSSNNSNDQCIQQVSRNGTNSTQARVTPPQSTSSSLDYLHKLDDVESEFKNKKIRMTRSSAQTGIGNSKEGIQGLTDSNWDGVNADDIEDIYDNELEYEPIAKASEEVELSQDVEEEQQQNDDRNDFRRRSTRISKQQEQKKLEGAKRQNEMLHQDSEMDQTIQYDSNIDGNPDERTDIKDLYESLVPKIKTPSRRSDWVLPPRLKYQPEKPIRTKVVVDSIKVHELIDTDRIAKILSHFEGGVAGIRKTFNTNRSSTTPPTNY
ncbi:repression factor of MSEs protein 1 [Monosporozyma servazzii]